MRHARVIAALAGVVIALTACGGGSDGGSSGSSGSSAKPFAGDTAQQVLDKAVAAAKGASSVHLKGASKEQGSEFQVDMVLSDKQGAQGTISVAGQNVELRQVGDTMYVKGGPTAQLGPKYADKWLKTKAGSGGAADFSTLTSMDTFFGDALKPDGAVTLVDGKEVDGKQTVGLQDSKTGSDKGILYIAAEGQPYPLLVTSGASSTDGLHFFEWNKPVTVTAPPADQVVDQSEIGKG
jgi:hypothetical protein